MENTTQDMELLLLAIGKLKSTQDKDVDTPGLGMVVMRALYYLQNDAIAQQLYEELHATELFQRTKSQLIYFNLLYDKEKYGQIIADSKHQIDRLCNKQQRMSRAIGLLFFAACYKENTNLSFEYAKHLHDTNTEPRESREHLIYLSALALKQDSPHMAERYLAETWPAQRSAITNLRLKVALEHGQLGDAIIVLESVLTGYGDFYDKLCFSAEVIEYAESLFQKSSVDQFRLDFETLLPRLRDHEHIVDKSLDELLLELTQSEDNRNRAIAYNKRLVKNRRNSQKTYLS